MAIIHLRPPRIRLRHGRWWCGRGKRRTKVTSVSVGEIFRPKRVGAIGAKARYPTGTTIGHRIYHRLLSVRATKVDAAVTIIRIPSITIMVAWVQMVVTSIITTTITRILRHPYRRRTGTIITVAITITLAAVLLALATITTI